MRGQVWCTNLQAVLSVWWSLWNAAWTALWLLRMSLWWALWFVTLGTFNVASPLQPSHAAAHTVQPRSLADAAPPSLEDGGAAKAQYWYLAAAGFCLCQVLSAWCKYAVTKGGFTVRQPCVPPCVWLCVLPYVAVCVCACVWRWYPGIPLTRL